MFLAALLKGIALGFMLSISVGPVVFTIIKQSINNGHKGGFAFIAGVAASDIVIVILSNIFAELVTTLLGYQKIIGICGSILLISLGIYVIFFKKVAVNDTGAQVIKMDRDDYIKVFLSGFLINAVNPAVIGFWLITSTSLASQAIGYRAIVFISCLLVIMAFDVAKVLLAGKIRNKLTPHNIHIINRVGGMILIGFGIALIWGILAYGNAGSH